MQRSVSKNGVEVKRSLQLTSAALYPEDKHASQRYIVKRFMHKKKPKGTIEFL